VAAVVLEAFANMPALGLGVERAWIPTVAEAGRLTLAGASNSHATV
jgi:hypothetical protein